VGDDARNSATYGASSSHALGVDPERRRQCRPMPLDPQDLVRLVLSWRRQQRVPKNKGSDAAVSTEFVRHPRL
jgi:hypothetical protein